MTVIKSSHTVSNELYLFSYINKIDFSSNLQFISYNVLYKDTFKEM
jgi:hypothetical protein